jgi:hypothetical protein
MVSWNFCQAHLLEVGLTKIPGARPWLFFLRFSQHDRFHNIFQGKFQERQTPPINSLNLTHIILNQILPLFFRQQITQWSRNMVHSHVTLCVRARDYIKRLSQHPWYGLWMRVKVPHHYKETTLGSCVKWPLWPLHTRDWEPVTITLQAFSLVEKAELVQVRVTLRLRGRRSTWVQDGW